MRLLWPVTALCLGLASLCLSLDEIFNQSQLETSLNANRDGNITSDEVDAFLAMLAGNSPVVTRCIFLDEMVDKYTGSPLLVSTLYDVMQRDNGQVLSQEELRAAFLGGATTTVSLAVFRNNIATLEQRVKSVLAAPNQNSNGPTYWKYTDYQINNWANSVDSNGDGQVTRNEVTVAMRKLDSNNDYAVRRCEYVDSMMSYKQHAVSANKVYDVIFKSRDFTWADVDSDFLLNTMNNYVGTNVTKQEFINYFTVQNTIASGLTVNYDGSVVSDPDGDNAQMTRFSLLCITSSIFVCLLANL